MNLQLTGTYTDLYQLAMGQAYYLNNYHTKQVTFDYFFRRPPFDGGYAVFAGLADLLNQLATLQFTDDDIKYLKDQGFDKNYLTVLKNFKFNGSIYGPPEGEVIFQTEPILRVEGNILEAQLIETFLLNTLNFQSLIATKAARIRFAAPDKIISEFGLRRAQGIGGFYASRAAVIGGADSTSNVAAAKHYGLKASGTMAHSYVQMFDEELQAFRSFANSNPENCILLVDTYNTLKSGVLNAITVAKEMEKKEQRLYAIRLDSGDLSYLARKSRQLLDDAGLHYVKIAASNQLDEYVVRSLIHQKAPIDIFGVGTNLAIGKPDAALDGVYKLVTADNIPRIKVSENLEKTTLPEKKQVHRLLHKDGTFFGADAITEIEEGKPNIMTAPFNPHKSMEIADISSTPLLQPLMKKGKIIQVQTDIEEIKRFSAERLALLPPEYKRFENPHVYKIGISPRIKKIRDDLFSKYSGRNI